MELKRDELSVLPLDSIGEIDINNQELKVIKEDIDIISLLREECEKRVVNFTEKQKEDLKKVATAHAFSTISGDLTPEQVDEITGDILDSIDPEDNALKDIEQDIIENNEEKIFVTEEELEQQVVENKEYMKFSNVYKLLKLEIERLEGQEQKEEVKERIDALRENVTEIREEMGATRSYYSEEGYDELKENAKEQLEKELSIKKEEVAASVLYPKYYEENLSEETIGSTIIKLIETESFGGADASPQTSAESKELDAMFQEDKSTIEITNQKK